MSKIQEAVKIALKAKHIMIMTGAGISVASGLPTYRGKDGLWTKKVRNQNPMRFATKAYFDMAPYECWKNSYHFHDLAVQNPPNIIHHSILKMQEHCKNSNVKLELVTQNIDGYHARLLRQSPLFKRKYEPPEGSELYGFTDDVYEIHGNTFYMRCSYNSCSNSNLYKTPDVYNEFETPRCKVCDSIMRRNTLLFDETYNEKYFRSHTVLNLSQQCDLLIIAGTELKTNLPRKIVDGHMKRNVDILEFNLNGCTESYGKLVSVLGKCEETIPPFINSYISINKP